MNPKKRIMSLIISVLIIISLLPVSASAESIPLVGQHPASEAEVLPNEIRQQIITSVGNREIIHSVLAEFEYEGSIYYMGPAMIWQGSGGSKAYPILNGEQKIADGQSKVLHITIGIYMWNGNDYVSVDYQTQQMIEAAFGDTLSLRYYVDSMEMNVPATEAVDSECSGIKQVFNKDTVGRHYYIADGVLDGEKYTSFGTIKCLCSKDQIAFGLEEANNILKDWSLSSAQDAPNLEYTLYLPETTSDNRDAMTGKLLIPVFQNNASVVVCGAGLSENGIPKTKIYGNIESNQSGKFYNLWMIGEESEDDVNSSGERNCGLYGSAESVHVFNCRFENFGSAIDSTGFKAIYPIETECVNCNVTSGNCGAEDNDVRWSLSSDGTLTIFGIGAMMDYDFSNDVPWDVSYVKKIVVQSGVSHIGNFAFDYCRNLMDVEMSTGLESIGDGAFLGCTNLANIELPSGVTEIGNGAFASCSSLENAVIPSSVTHIGMSVFYACKALKSVDIPGSAAEIGDLSFYGCESLQNISIQNGVERIGVAAFQGCDGLRSISIPNSVTEIYGGAFIDCSNLSSIFVDPQNEFYQSVDGVLFNKSGTNLIAYPAKDDSSYIIPDGVKKIESAAFSGNSHLTNVIIPNGVLSIEDDAFSFCNALTSITIPYSMRFIGTRAFDECGSNELTISFLGTRSQWNSIYIDDTGNDALKNAVIKYQEKISGICGADGDNVNWQLSDDGIMTISGFGAMREFVDVPPWYDLMQFIQEVIISDGVTSVGADSFNGCSNLEAISLPSTLITIGDMAFAGCRKLDTFRISNCEYADTLVLPDSVTHVGLAAFTACEGFTQVNLPAYLNRVEDMTFLNCSSVCAVFIPDSVLSIGESAFETGGTIETVHYHGTRSEFDQIQIEEGNDTLLLAADFKWQECIHSFEAIEAKAATCTTEGNESYQHCTKCDRYFSSDSDMSEISENEMIILALGHNYANGICTRCGAVDPDFNPNAAKITVDTVRGTAGKTVKVTVKAENNPGIVSMTLKVEYDPAVLTLVGVTDKGLIPNAMHTTKYASPYTLTWENDTAASNFTEDGALVELIFEIAEDAEPGEYPIRIGTVQDGIYNFDADNIDFAMINGAVIVSTVLPGDVNGDGVVTNKDRLLLSRYLANWEGYDESDIDMLAADVNCDGVVTNKDRLILSRYLANWAGYETLPMT